MEIKRCCGTCKYFRPFVGDKNQRGDCTYEVVYPESTYARGYMRREVSRDDGARPMGRWCRCYEERQNG